MQKPVEALLGGMRMFPPPRAHSPHLYALRTHSLIQWAAPRQGRGAKRQVEASGGDLREGKGHQGPTDHYEVENVPEVAEVGTLVQDEPQVDHLGVRRDGGQNPHPTLGSETHLSSLWGRGIRRGHRRPLLVLLAPTRPAPPSSLSSPTSPEGAHRHGHESSPPSAQNLPWLPPRLG